MSHAEAFSDVGLAGRFGYERWSADGELLAAGTLANGVATGGLNDMLEATFRGGSQRGAWYVGLVSLTGWTAFSAADTMSSHAGWSESVNYVQSTRVQWSPSLAVAGVVTNAAGMQFTMNANETIKGLFVSSGSLKGTTTGILWSTAAFSANQQMSSGEILRITYTLTASAGVEG